MDQRLAIPLLVGISSLAVVAQDSGAAPVDYTFQTDGLYMAGVKSLAELRGRPVFVEFWGTR